MLESKIAIVAINNNSSLYVPIVVVRHYHGSYNELREYTRGHEKPDVRAVWYADDMSEAWKFRDDLLEYYKDLGYIRGDRWVK